MTGTRFQKESNERQELIDWWKVVVIGLKIQIMHSVGRRANG
jgi:hypothetical protein